MTIKGKSFSTRHVSRTRRVDLYWLFGRIHLDLGIQTKYVKTIQQIADILTRRFVFFRESWSQVDTAIQHDDTRHALSPPFYSFLFARAERQQDVETAR